jgi:hypothetical protein
MRGALFVCLALFVCVQPARAQMRLYVAGDLFAEIMRSSRTTAPDILASGPDTSPRDDATIGGGGRIGAFFTPAWSLELGLDFGKTVSEERTLSIRVPIGFTIPSSGLQYQSRTSHRFSASSVLIGYHPPARGRIQAGFRGGVSFMHTERMFTNTTFAGLTLTSGFPGLPPATTISLLTDEYTTVTNGLTATLAAEAAIDMSGHFAIVPEARAHAGGLGGFLLRPGVAARWRW